MNPPAHQGQPPVQIGYDLAGQPMYAPPTLYAYQPAEQRYPLEPIKAHPWGVYLAGGCLGVLALSVLVVAIAFVVFGFAILAAVLALTVVVLTICVVILRSVWQQQRKTS